MAVNYAMFLQDVKVPVLDRWLYTTSLWPRGEMLFCQVKDRDSVPPQILCWIEDQCLDSRPVDEKNRITFLFTVLTALRQREVDLVPKEVRQARAARSYHTQMNNLATRSDAEILEDAWCEQVAQIERPEARLHGLKALSKITPKTKVHTTKREECLETGAAADTVICAMLQEDGGFFRWYNVDLDGIGATSANTRTNGLLDQMFTEAQLDYVSSAGPAGYYAIEMWWCHLGWLYARSTCQRSSVCSTVDSQFSLSNSKVQLKLTNGLCLLCKETILGSGTEPQCRPVEKTVGLAYHTGVSRRASTGGDNAPVCLTIAADNRRGAPFHLDLEQLPPPTVSALFPNQKRRQAKQVMHNKRNKAAATNESDAHLDQDKADLSLKSMDPICESSQGLDIEEMPKRRHIIEGMLLELCQPSEPPILKSSTESANEEVLPRKKAKKEVNSGNISAQLPDVQYILSNDNFSSILLSSPLVSTAL
ncbi:hypothetical protein TREMEDRAFT_58515 [Tremella mesenterica DSM 1558]|uniref:uncharacterized protein n=1 Tax=Tremella mesenterica (strain ATCC 24925 / CBS 8224 / DSM 1558 / NBRC 9311 / NRRL Y-6157 / RJB 2259-6 / UBC 559-6) TaxID=578456 RepID=UPI0003F498C0|nr:uncharacterized protein TREMEDRAFT_58515 [Tremella mesenterica DSM 1558]EIW72355.1 hypothetical protein TREMEDRAFT_58515 [Tremella mesenterica DSM 1558]